MLLVFAVAGLSAAVDALFAGWVLLHGRDRVSVSRMLGAATAAAVFIPLKALVVVTLLPATSLFAVVMLAYAWLAAGLPALGVAVLLEARRRAIAPAVRWTARLSLLAVPAALWCSFVEPFRLQVEETVVPLAAERAGHMQLRIGVLADVQAREVTDFEREAVARLMALHPDLILIPGDLAQVWPRSRDEVVNEFQHLVAPLDAPLGVWMVLGNSDDPELVGRVLEGTSVRLLQDESVELVHADRRITLCGIGMSFRSQRARRAVEELETTPGNEDVRLLLTHFPDAYDLLRVGTRVDLLVAGHTHGGQVQLPLIGPPVTLTGVPRRVAAGGLSELDGRRLYVSRGLGVERGWAPRLRLACPPEVTLLVLGDAVPDSSAIEGNPQARRDDSGGPP